MSLKTKVLKSQLKRLGIDMSNPKQVTKKAIRDLISTSVPSLISPSEMVIYLNEQIDKLEKEYQV